MAQHVRYRCLGEPVDGRVRDGVPTHRVFVDLLRGRCVLEGEANPTIDRALFVGGATWMTAAEDLPQFHSDHLSTESDARKAPSLRSGAGARIMQADHSANRGVMIWELCMHLDGVDTEAGSVPGKRT